MARFMVTTRSKHRPANEEVDQAITTEPTYRGGADRQHRIGDDSGQSNKKRRQISKLSRSIGTAGGQSPSEATDTEPDGPIKSVLEDIPLDLIFEIFSFLHPLDLVSFAFTSKSIRNTLMSPASVSIWRSTRLAIDPSTPDCPLDQNETRWAILLYGTNCMICDSTEPTDIQWNLRLRGCMPCLNGVLIKRSEVIKEFPKIRGLVRPPKASTQSPQSKSLNRRRRIGQTFPQAEDLNEILSLLPFSRRTELIWRGGEPWYHRASVKKIVTMLISLQAEARSCVQGTEGRLDAFKAARTQGVLNIMSPEPVLKQWIAPIENMRKGRSCIKYRQWGSS